MEYAIWLYLSLWRRWVMYGVTLYLTMLMCYIELTRLMAHRDAWWVTGMDGIFCVTLLVADVILMIQLLDDLHYLHRTS